MASTTAGKNTACWDKGASISQLGFTTNLSAYRNVQETWLAACECPAYREPLAAQAALALTQALCPLSTLSDHTGCAEGVPAADAHFPAAADLHRHRPPEGGQQVQACLGRRGAEGKGWAQ